MRYLRWKLIYLLHECASIVPDRWLIPFKKRTLFHLTSDSFAWRISSLCTKNFKWYDKRRECHVFSTPLFMQYTCLWMASLATSLKNWAFQVFITFISPFIKHVIIASLTSTTINQSTFCSILFPLFKNKSKYPTCQYGSLMQWYMVSL